MTVREYYDAAYAGTGNPDDLVALVGDHAAEEPPIYLRMHADGHLLIGDNGGTEVLIEDDADIEAEITTWLAAAECPEDYERPDSN